MVRLPPHAPVHVDSSFKCGPLSCFHSPAEYYTACCRSDLVVLSAVGSDQRWASCRGDPPREGAGSYDFAPWWGLAFLTAIAQCMSSDPLQSAMQQWCPAYQALSAMCRETEFFALTNAASWLQPYGKFFMVSILVM